MFASLLAHVGHDHGCHHWLPSLIAAAAVATAWIIARRVRRCLVSREVKHGR